MAPSSSSTAATPFPPPPHTFIPAAARVSSSTIPTPHSPPTRRQPRQHSTTSRLFFLSLLLTTLLLSLLSSFPLTSASPAENSQLNPTTAAARKRAAAAALAKKTLSGNKKKQDDETPSTLPRAVQLGRRPKKSLHKKSKSKKNDSDVIPFLASTRFKSGDALTSGGAGVLGKLAKKAGKVLVNSSAFRFVAEEKIFETVIGMLAYRVAFQWSKDPSSARKARLLFTLYVCLYLGALLYCRKQALLIQDTDTRTVKVAAMPAMLTGLMDMAKKMKKGGEEGGIGAGLAGIGGLATSQEKEMTFKEYDLGQIKTALDRFTMFLCGMTFLHFKMKNIYMIMYWGLLGPVMMVREPLFQVYVFGMEEVGIRERPFGPKEVPEEVEEGEEGEEGGEKGEGEDEVAASGEEEGEEEGGKGKDGKAEEEEQEEEEEDEDAQSEKEEEGEEEEEEEEEEEGEEEEGEEEEEEEEEEETGPPGDGDDEPEEIDIASDHAQDEHPDSFHVDVQEEDVHPHMDKKKPQPSEFHVEKLKEDEEAKSSSSKE